MSLLAGGSSAVGAATIALALMAPAGLLERLLPQSVERWLWNPRERTEQAIEAEKAGDPQAGLAAADAALRLAPDDPRVQYDVGTLHLQAGDARGALGPLESAAQNAPPSLAPAAWYNLGGARLAAGDAAGAVEALKQALRLAPTDLATKHNLELALAEREKEKLRAKNPREGDRGDRQGEGESGKNGGGSGTQETQDGDGQSRGENAQTGPQGNPRPGTPPSAAGDARQPVRWKDQPDMTAAQAEAILRAVENLERTERKKLAAQRAQATETEIDDW